MNQIAVESLAAGTDKAETWFPPGRRVRAFFQHLIDDGNLKLVFSIMFDLPIRALSTLESRFYHI